VNGTRIDKAFVLSRADVIRIGTEEFRFYADVRPTATSAPPAAPPAIAPPAVSPAPPAPVVSPAPGVSRDARPVLATLEVTNSGIMKGQTFEIHVPLAHVGRGSHNDIVIQDDSVSETHAKLQRRDDGWYVVDAGSTNGTYVGGQRLTAERRLDGAPDVRFGGVKMVFRAVDVPLDGVGGDGTRAIAMIDPATLRPTAHKSRVPTPASAPQASPPPPIAELPKPGLPTWVWIVVALAIAGAVALFVLNR
jgi:pSer/pThr/pTyr-binding forkhead associated (FHA) protein